MESTLAVIGVNFRTAPLAIRERFWISKSQCYESLIELAPYEAIDEVVVLATCNRTEFVVWTNDITVAANSVLRFLSAHHGLRLCDWKNFYRLFDEAALTHVFRVASTLDSMMLGNNGIAEHVNSAWKQAQKAGTAGRFLDAVFERALAVAERIRKETAVGTAIASIPKAAMRAASRIFGNLAERRILLIGSGNLIELAATCLESEHVRDIVALTHTYEIAEDVAEKLGATPVRFEQRWEELAKADVVITSTSCPHFAITREDAEQISKKRNGIPLCLIDIGVPRDIDPAVREIPNVFLYDIDDLANVVNESGGERKTAVEEAETTAAAEARMLRTELIAESLLPPIVGFRNRLDEICNRELQAYLQELGPIPPVMQRPLKDLTARIAQRITGSLSHQLKNSP